MLRARGDGGDAAELETATGVGLSPVTAELPSTPYCDEPQHATVWSANNAQLNVSPSARAAAFVMLQP